MSSPLPDWRTRIVCDPAIRHGEPTIRGTRIAVATIVATLSDLSMEQVLAEFPQLTRDDVRAALLFAAESAHNSLVA
jgi:uncharacterized protein (DUF433 family)